MSPSPPRSFNPDPRERTRFDRWPINSEAREQGSGLTQTPHPSPLAFDATRPDGTVEHFEIDGVPLERRFVNTSPAEEPNPACGYPGAEPLPTGGFPGIDRAKAFADRMVAAGVRFEAADLGETYEVERVFVDGRLVETPIVNRGRKREPDGQSALPRFSRYAIPHEARPGEVPCPYCVKRPIGAKGLRDHCRAVHPDKPEAR